MNRTIPAALLVVTLSACGADAVQRTAPVAGERFAREYVTVLRDSGAAAVLPRTKSSTRELPGFEASMTTLQKALAEATRDSLVLTSWEIDRSSERQTATEFVYRVYGVASPLEVGLWVEREDGRLVVETIYSGPPKR